MIGTNKKINFALVFCVQILSLSGLILSGCGVNYDEIGIVKASWDIDLPQPLNIIDVASNISGLPADGTEYSVLEYSDEIINELKKLNYWGSADTIISDGIKNSLKGLEESSEVSNKNKELMKKYPPEANESCLYYYKDKGTSKYLIMMLDVSKNRVYIFRNQ